MKATGHYTPVVLFMICTGRMVPTFESRNEIQQYDNSNESFWGEHFPVVPFITLHWVVLTFKSVDEISKYDSKKDTEQYFTVTLFTLYTLYEVVNWDCG